MLSLVPAASEYCHTLFVANKQILYMQKFRSTHPESAVSNSFKHAELQVENAFENKSLTMTNLNFPVVSRLTTRVVTQGCSYQQACWLPSLTAVARIENDRFNWNTLTTSERNGITYRSLLPYYGGGRVLVARVSV